jgi:hypothetical protein
MKGHQCPSCLEYFSSHSSADMHRAGSFTGGTRHCLTFSEMMAKGMTLNKDDCWILPRSNSPAQQKQPAGGTRTIHAAEWRDLIDNGHPQEGRFYVQDPDVDAYIVFNMAEQTVPQNLDADGKPIPARRATQQACYIRRKAKRISVAPRLPNPKR